MKKILVTGGSGFIGTNFLKSIASQFSEVRSNYFKNEKFFRVDKVNYIKADLEDISECKKICKEIDVVVMCAANSSGAGVMEKTPLVHLTPNIRMNLNMLEAAYECGVKKFIFISSNTVYPHVDFAVKETDSQYSFFEKYHVVGWMKKFTEEVCEIYSKKIKDKMTTIIVRPGNLYGPYDKFDVEKSKVIASLIRKVVEKQNPINVWGDGEDIKDFLYIDDFIDGLKKIVFNINSFETLNLASGKGITIKEILKMIIRIEKAENLKVEFDKSKPTMIPKRLIDISKAEKIINFSPSTSMENGLVKTIKWFKETA
ncbi:NAD(P)-dependent oxidoreductase [Candidatus Pelagibacter sp.]|nr:NAD(P)-dependent oxidoreductase [Candidatus Pelagibacter sp.]